MAHSSGPSENGKRGNVRLSSDSRRLLAADWKYFWRFVHDHSHTQLRQFIRKVSAVRLERQEILAKGIVERVGIEGAFIKHSTAGKEELTKEHPAPIIVKPSNSSSNTLVDKTARRDRRPSTKSKRSVIGSFTAGKIFPSRFSSPMQVLEAFKDGQSARPLHNPANIMGIEAASSVLPTYRTARSWTPPGIRLCHGSLSLRTALRVVPGVQCPALRFSRHLVSLYGETGRGAARQRSLRDEPHHRPHRERLEHQCGRERRLGRYIDGTYPARRARHGYPRRRYDPAIPFYMMRKTGMTAGAGGERTQ